MKHLLLLLSVAVLLAGCATSQTSSQNKDKKDSVVDQRLLQKARAMNIKVHGVLETQSEGGACSPAITKLKIKWSWQEAVNVANKCLKSHDLNAVDVVANDLATREPSTPWGPYFMARLALERNQLDRALWMVELSLKRAPEFGVIHYLKGQILWARNENKEAVDSFEKCLTFDDGIAPAHLILGQIYLRDQDYAKAAPQFAVALRALPDNIYALNGQAEAQLHLNNPQVALDSYYRLSQIESFDGQYLTHVGEIYEGALNNPSKALWAYKKLHDQIKSGKIKKNIDPDNESKIKELESSIEKARAVASTQDTQDKAPKGESGGKK